MTRECSKCHVTKNVALDFCFKTGRTNPASYCKQCATKGGEYTRTYRERKRFFYQDKFLEQQAESKRKWREQNAEHCKEYTNKYQSSIDYKVRCYQNRALEKRLLFDVKTANWNKDLFTQPCLYCARAPDTGKSNGIDRVDNELGYTLDNLVSCCFPSNLIKWTVPIAEILDLAKIVSSHHPMIDTNVTYPSSRMENAKKEPTRFENIGSNSKNLQRPG
jgi:hypothetical protein